MKSVLIVGSGIGGLATALRLTSAGYKVTIIEKNSQAGGRLNRIRMNGFTFDTGPSFFSMSYEFKELVESSGMSTLPFECIELDPLYTVNFTSDGKTFHLYKDITKLAAQFEGIEDNFEEKMHKYLAKCEAIFKDTVDIVIKQNFNSLAEYAKALMTINPQHLPVLMLKFNQQVNLYFESKEARQIISLVAFFLGRTPFDTSAIYTLLSHTEFQHDGYYNVVGGMYKIVEGFVAELESRGVEFVYDTKITDYQASGKTLTGLIDQNGKVWHADAFVINADAALFRGTVFKRSAFTTRKLDRKKWTMGYLTFYLGIKGKLPHVAHHNYYLGQNFNAYACDVTKNPLRLQKPYYYVNVLSKHNLDCAPDGCEALFFVCPVPDLRYKPNWDDKNEIVDSIIDDFSTRVGRDIRQDIVSKAVYTPLDWQERFNLYRGSGLGLSHSMFQVGYLRPKNIDEQFINTFYVGASTTPGAGIPMSVIGSKLTYQRILDWDK